MQDHLKLALLQAPLISGDTQANLDWFSRHMAQLDSDLDLLVLPEVFSTGFGSDARKFPAHEHSEHISWMRSQARALDAVVTGSLVFRGPEPDSGLYFNRLIWMQPDGQYHYYDKRHLFRMAGEHKRYAQGERRVIMEIKGWRVLPLVCYDLRFPVWSRNCQDYDVLLYVANWPAARADHWVSLLKARAIENLSYCIGVNRLGSDSAGNSYQGDSQVYAPDGKLLVDMATTEGVARASLSRDELLQYRERFPAYLDADRFTID